MIVLKIIGWIILVILALLLLALVVTVLLLSIKLTLGLDLGQSGTKVRLKWGFFKLNLYPEQFTPEKMEYYKSKIEWLKQKFGPIIDKFKSKQEKKKAEQEEQEEPQQETDFDDVWAKVKAFDFEGAFAKARSIYFRLGAFEGIVELLQYIASKTKSMIAKILKKIVIKELFVDLTVAGDDAADTAINYGKTCATVFPSIGVICTNMKVREYDVEIEPDFLARKCTGDLHAVIAFRPIFILMALMGYGIKVMNKIIFKLLFSRGESNENINENGTKKEKIKDKR
ncbi:MAG: DUF2953 domain-containing protein, partial [Oscillospiraceae bacterium]